MNNVALAVAALETLSAEQPNISFRRLLAEVAGEYEVTESEILEAQRRANHAAFAAEQAYDRGELEGQPVEAWRECCVCRYCQRGNDVCICD